MPATLFKILNYNVIKMIKYPDGTTYKNTNNKLISLRNNHANRGMSFEDAINKTNEYYIKSNIALIYKRPTPIKIIRMDRYNTSKITEAYFAEKSTTDYNGIYKSKYIDFEAKSTISKTSFPLNNISTHQIKHLEKVLSLGGIAFFLIELKSIHEVYLLFADFIVNFYKSNKRKSIPFSEIKKNGYLIKEGYLPRYNYLKVLDDLHLTKQ